MTRPRQIAVVLSCALAFAPGTARAQGIRITGITTAQYIDLRPWVDDSISSDSTTGTSSGLRLSTRGVVVQCDSGAAFCRYKRSANDALSTLPLMQDLLVSGWGLGQGIQIYAHGRFRTAVGEAHDIWPRADDPFDLLAGYVEVDRNRFIARLGRQYATNGLGTYNFDGGTLTLFPTSNIEVGVFGGWALERGLNEPATSGEIAAVENIPPLSRGLLIGVDARYKPSSALALGAAYHREGAADRSGLYQDRIAADGELRMGRWGIVNGDLEVDLATTFVNEALLRAQVPMSYGLTLVGELRRYRPFFELWTIWGAFSPVGYNEASAGTDYTTADGRLSLSTRGSYRHYGDARTGLETVPMREDGWSVDVDGSWRVKTAWLVNGDWRTQLGFGASRTDFDAGLQWQPIGRRVFAGVRGTYFQDVYEFRVGTGHVIGFGVDGGATLRSDIRLVGDAAFYHHSYGDHAPETNWGQTRASLRLEWTLGGDPGLRRVTMGGPK